MEAPSMNFQLFRLSLQCIHTPIRLGSLFMLHCIQLPGISLTRIQWTEILEETRFKQQQKYDNHCFCQEYKINQIRVKSRHTYLKNPRSL